MEQTATYIGNKNSVEQTLAVRVERVGHRDFVGTLAVSGCARAYFNSSAD